MLLHKSLKSLQWPSKQAKLAITRERSIILQIQELKSKKMLLEAYIDTLTYTSLILEQL